LEFVVTKEIPECLEIRDGIMFPKENLGTGGLGVGVVVSVFGHKFCGQLEEGREEEKE
jgi:hypothetical protein